MEVSLLLFHKTDQPIGRVTFDPPTADGLTFEADLPDIAEPGAVLGEVSILLGSDHGATVTATAPSRVHVMEEPLDALTSDAEVLLEVARGLARRLNRLNAYLSDIKAQYGNESGHLGMVDEVLAQLSFGEHGAVEPGSERDPDPYY